MTDGTLFQIFPTSTVICKQRLLHENEVAKYLQKYKYFEVEQDYIGKSLHSSIKTIKLFNESFKL